MKRLSKAERDRVRQYKIDRAAMIEKALEISIDGLKDSIKTEWKLPTLPYLVFDAMLAALEIKLGRKEYNLFIDSL